jgi:hypothetical protein
MSKIDYAWSVEKPPTPDVYTTRRNQSRYLTLRYWDGSAWFEIAWGISRGGVPFTWPKKSRSRKPTYCVGREQSLRLRKITASLGGIQWGEPFKVFDEKEVLAYLVKVGALPKDWRTEYQPAMRAPT